MMSPEESNAKRAQWLASLKPGDQVAVPSRSTFDRPHEILTVERLTATQFVVSDAVERKFRFRRNTGGVVGTGYSRIYPVTRALLNSNEQYELRRWISEFGHIRDKSSLPKLNVLRAMKAAYDAAIAAEAS